MRRFTSIGCSSTSSPHTETVPELGGIKPVIMRMVVDLPAPLGPRNPRTSPLATSKETASTARFCPKDLLRFSTLIIARILFLTTFTGSEPGDFKPRRAFVRPAQRLTGSGRCRDGPHFSLFGAG